MTKIKTTVCAAALASLMSGTGLAAAQEFGLGVDYGTTPPAPRWGLGVDTTLPTPNFDPAPALPSIPQIDIQPVTPAPEVRPFLVPIPDARAPGVIGGVTSKDGTIYGTFRDKPSGPEGEIKVTVPNPLTKTK
ncbi:MULTISPECIES: hypothetical protein [unclassified Mesorhizobium]|uniref:hypothetical protein n=1 Tax=unclassified Mesorhizobium TaxID=325217 RepID=UPI000FD9F366|nr:MULTISPECIES: hypothetical protein [unclassified Mesorhizobium]TGT71801.1 hypothetical protein EN809_016615 [Mesorhizobium sp. M2E.F.Ca.ET.166.01.1.1]TGV99485.1 hypothetical protein EN797_024640 [Mesorhizobium sp. M2E.F.Ca.ET.154.01.1.1]